MLDMVRFIMLPFLFSSDAPNNPFTVSDPGKYSKLPHKTMKYSLTIIYCTLIVIMLTGCTMIPVDNFAPIRKPAQFVRLDFPDHVYDNLIWFPDGGLIALSNADKMVSGKLEVIYATESSIALEKVFLEADTYCQAKTIYYWGGELPDSRIGSVKLCLMNDYKQDAKYLSSYDWRSGKVEQIVAGPLPNKLAGWFTWNSTMTRGVQDDSDGMVGTLYWITSQGYEPMDLVLEQGNKKWSLKDAFLDESQYSDNPQFNNYGIAHSPAWSPNDQQIAFWASFAAIGQKGFSRLDSEYQLVFLNPDDMSYTITIRNIYHPGHLDWSPDGAWLAFWGNYGKSFGDTNELWLYSPDKNELISIGTGIFRSLAWSPGGDELAVLQCKDLLCEEGQEVIQFDVADIVLHEK